MQQQRARLRAVALLALGVLVAARVGGFAHLAAERHVACAEHGDLLDVDSSTDLASAGASTDVSVVASTDPHAHGEQHCAFNDVFHAQGALDSSVPVVESAPAVDPIASPIDAAVVTRDIYLLAPKTSPPASPFVVA